MISAKFDSYCKVNPQHHWKIGTRIYYDKGLKIACNDPICFHNRGGQDPELNPKDFKQSSYPPQTQDNQQKIENVGVTKYVFTHLQEEEMDSIVVQTRELYEILQVIKLELTEESNPAVIGMIFNALVTKLASKKE